jgi:phosphatidylserine decarboxylase
METLQRIITSVLFQRLVNKRMFSAFFGWVANRKLPHRFLLRLLDGFSKTFHTDIAEFEFDRSTVRTFNEFFARELKPGARTLHGPICSPADGFISSFGPVADYQLFQVKGKPYPLNDLIGEQSNTSATSFLSIYLSLGDYHRVHMPFDATLLSIKRIPGTLYSLSPNTLEKIDRVYCRNERVVMKGVSAFGNFYLILVGAIVVGKIVLNKNAILNAEIKQGTEIGHFKMGSSVLLVVDSDILANLPDTIQTHLKMGDALC